jgi:hypothetical protein
MVEVSDLTPTTIMKILATLALRIRVDNAFTHQLCQLTYLKVAFLQVVYSTLQTIDLVLAILYAPHLALLSK